MHNLIRVFAVRNENSAFSDARPRYQKKIPKVACALTHVQIPTKVDANKKSQAWKFEK